MRFYPLVQFVLFQATWCACILGGAAGQWVWGVASATLLVVVHLAVTRRWRDLILIGVAAAIGLVLDSALGLAGLCRFMGGGVGGALAPAWMVALWAAFAPNLTVSCAWLVPRPWLALAFGAVGGPLAYLAGGRLGAVSWPAGEVAGLAGVAVEWMLAMLALIGLVRHLNRGAQSHA